MAGGNLGDLEFGLTLKSRIESEAQKVVKVLNDIDATGKKAQDAVSSLTDAFNNINGQGLDKIREKLKTFTTELDKELGKDDFDANRIKNLQKLIEAYSKIYDIRKEMGNQKIDSLHIFPNGISKEVNSAEKEINKLSSMLSDMGKKRDEGLRYIGYRKTGNLDKSITELTQYKNLLEQIWSNGGTHPSTGLSAKDILGSADYKKALDNAKAYAREVDKANKEEISRMSKVESQRKKELKESADRYSNLLDIWTRLQSSMEKSVPLKIDTKEAEAKIADIEAKMKGLEDIRKKLNTGQGTAVGKLGDLGDKKYQSSAEAVAKAQERAIREAEKARKEAQAAEAKAAKESETNEKKRQAEIEITKQRIQSLGLALRDLEDKASASKKIGIDTSDAEAKVRYLSRQMEQLYAIQTGLKSGDLFYLGRVGNLGNGREVQSARILAEEYGKINKVQAELARGFEKANMSAGKLSSTVQDLKSLFLQGGLVFGAQQFAMNIITVGGEMEKQHIAMQSILGDMQNANTLFGQIKELALNSPFTFSELNRDVKQLAAYGVEYDQLYDTTKRLADMSSGLGVSFDRIALAFGQVQARGWLDGKELRQIAYAGIPLLDKLSQYYSKREGKSVSTSQIKDRISKREVSFDDVKNIFWEMTDAGGQFYNMQQTLSETLLGRYNKLKDAWEIMLADFADGKSVIGGTFIFVIDRVTELVQALHTLAPVAAAAFSGFALTKAMSMMGGNAGDAFLAHKNQMAMDASAKLAAGERLNVVEREILATKNQITGSDLRSLVVNKAITQSELQRLVVAGKISAKQYQIYSALLKQQGAATSLNAKTVGYGLSWTRVGLTAKLAFGGIATAAKALWSAIGGLPGLVITGVTMAISYFYEKSAELTNAIERTQGELQDRQKQMNEFRNINDIGGITSRGDQKEIDGAIDSYKEKLKELAPYDYNLFVMNADEKKSHEDRLRYLDRQLEIMQKANKVVQRKLSDRDAYSDLQDRFKRGRYYVNDYTQSRNRYESFVPDKTKSAAVNARNLQNMLRWYKASAEKLDEYSKQVAKDVEDTFKGVKVPKEELLSMKKQAVEIMLSDMDMPEQQKKDFRLSVYKGLGVADDTLKTELGQRLAQSVNDSMPEVANAIRSGRQLDAASQEKVKKLLEGCVSEMKKDYPTFAGTLQKMLDASNFQAVIRLVYSSEGSSRFTEAEQSLYDQYIPPMMRAGSTDKDKKFATFLNSIGGSGKNMTSTDIVKSANERLKSLKDIWTDTEGRGFTQAYKDKAKKDYDDLHALYAEVLGGDFDVDKDKKKKVTPRKATSGTKEDKALKDLEKRVSLYKKLYGEIKKYKDLFGENAMVQLAKDEEFGAVFGDKKRFPITDYENYAQSINEMLKTLPANTAERKNFVAGEKVGIQSEARKQLEDNRKDELDTLGKQLDILQEQYATYKKLYELTGNKEDSMKVAFGNVVQSDSYKSMLEGRLAEAVGKSNGLLGTSYTPEDVKKMDLTETKSTFGEDTSVYGIRKRLAEETNRVKKETIDLMADLIEKNATIAQQIEDENHGYERQLELIEQMDDGPMKDRAKEGLKKSHDEKLSGLQFEQFKQETDWVTVFDDLDRVSTGTISSMIAKIDEFSKTTGLSVETVKQLRDALDKLRKENTSRNPIPGIFGGVKLGNAIGSFIKGNFAKGADGSSKVYVGDADAKRFGTKAGTYTKSQLEDLQQGAYANSRESINGLSDKFQALDNVLGPVVSLFEAMGDSDSVLSQMAGGTMGALGAGAQVSGGLKALGITGTAGVVGAGIGAGVSMVSTLIKTFGQADYSSYYKAKKEYENLVSIWDSLISKKTEYMNIHWGTEATKASEEARSMIQAEIDIAKATAQKALESGSSWGSASLQYRMWQGSYKYNGQNWQDVAQEISEKYGVKFDSMSDMLDMDYETLEKIKTDYSGLWANMDDDFRSYLEKLMDYGDQMDKLAESMTEKLTGNKFETLVSSWGDAMSQMSNTSDTLVDNFEDNMKKAILNSMIEDMYGNKIKAIMTKATTYMNSGGDAVDGDGNVMSNLSREENDDLMSDVSEVSKQIEATRDYMKKLYGWSDTSSSASKNSVKGITETQADGLLSYVNSIRADVSVIRSEQAKYLPSMSETTKAQLTQMKQIAENTLRNADAAERIDTAFSAFNDNFNKVIAGTKYLHVK